MKNQLTDLIKRNDLKELFLIQEMSMVYPKEFKELYEIKRKGYVEKYKS